MNWLQKIGGEVFRMEDYQQRIQVVSDLLRKLGFITAADDVTMDNYNRYAQWILNEARNRSVLTNVETRERIPQPKWERAERSIEETFKRLGIEPVVGETWLP